MDFALDSEQAMLRDSARGVLSQPHSDLWGTFADMGWLAMACPEDAGGLASAPCDIALLCEEIGRACASEPFVEGGVIATRLLADVATDKSRSMLELLSAGTARIMPALYEPGRRYALAPHTTATGDQLNGYRISGQKVLVAGGPDCSHLIVTAILQDEIALFLVDTQSAGVSIRSYETLDNRRYADFVFNDAAVDAGDFLGTLDPERLDSILDEARLYVCADMIGCLDRTFELTADYLKTRLQFGQPLANFQALQHSIADMFVEVEGARSSLLRALSFSRGEAGYRRAVSGCFVKTFGMAKRIAGMGVHLHGAIGFTTEYEVGHFLRRAMVSERLLGDVEFHLERYMAAA